jgi:transcriptional regulator with XRE-family HTH domain
VSAEADRRKRRQPARKLGELILKYRAEVNLSQSQLGELLYVPQQRVSDWERGAREPSSITLMAIAQVLGKSLQDFEVKL